ncbi:MAG TPA: hypothetical protein VFF69_11800 [Phycisphaerales bacterium]|nr:hypothetical protein [Phycisphaerales bacterium]
MATTRCPACGYELPDGAHITCPECGKRWRDREISAHWSREFEQLRRARRWYAIGGFGLLAWATSLGVSGAIDGDADVVAPALAFGSIGMLSAVAAIILAGFVREWPGRAFKISRWLSAPAEIVGGFGLFFGCYSLIPLVVTLVVDP